MRYIEKPEKPDLDEYEDELSEFIKKCYTWSDNTGLEIEKIACDYASLDELEEEASRMELIVEDIKKNEKEKKEFEKLEAEPFGPYINKLLKMIEDIEEKISKGTSCIWKIESRMDKLESQMFKRNQLEVMKGKMDSVITIINTHAEQIVDLMRKKDENEATS